MSPTSSPKSSSQAKRSPRNELSDHRSRPWQPAAGYLPVQTVDARGRCAADRARGARGRGGGAAAFTVVTGHEADAVETFLAGLSDRLGLPIATVRIADWDRPNGHSVL